jgi:phosphate transport system substrate-binding protein
MSRPLLPLAAALLLLPTGCSRAPDSGPAPHQIHIVGSSAAYPFSTYAAERLMRDEADAIAPLVRAGGSGEGIARFCDGPGRLHADIAVTTRDPTPEETQRCAAKGVAHVARVPLGFTAFVVVTARTAPDWSPTRALLSRAMTETAPNWSDLDPTLPATPIRIEGPAADPAIADGLFDRILLPGHAPVRRDGAYRGHGADAELVAEAVAAKPGAIGILPYAQAVAHADTVKMLPLDGIVPTPESIASGRYPASAPLLLLAKADEAPAVANMQHLLGYYADALAPGGAFATRGLVPLDAPALADAKRRLLSLEGH